MIEIGVVIVREREKEKEKGRGIVIEEEIGIGNGKGRGIEGWIEIGIEIERKYELDCVLDLGFLLIGMVVYNFVIGYIELMIDGIVGEREKGVKVERRVEREIEVGN